MQTFQWASCQDEGETILKNMENSHAPFDQSVHFLLKDLLKTVQCAAHASCEHRLIHLQIKRRQMVAVENPPADNNIGTLV